MEYFLAIDQIIKFLFAFKINRIINQRQAFLQEMRI